MSTWPSERSITLINLCQSRSIASLHSYTKTCITNYGHVWLPRRKDSYLSIVMYVMSSSVALMLAKTTADDTLMQSNTPNWQKWKHHTCQWRSSVKSQTHRNCHEFVQLRMQKPLCAKWLPTWICLWQLPIFWHQHSKWCFPDSKIAEGKSICLISYIPSHYTVAHTVKECFLLFAKTELIKEHHLVTELWNLFLYWNLVQAILLTVSEDTSQRLLTT